MSKKSSIFLIISALVLLGAVDSKAQSYPSWQDSLAARDGETERSLQFLLDSLGYDINVEQDDLGLEVFCVSNSENFARMILEVAYAAPNTKSGYYKAGDTANRHQLFSGSSHPGDFVDFTVQGFHSIGFYIFPNIPSIAKYWYTENAFNSDNFDHALVFATGIPNQYLICWEDLPDGGDEDFQDLVLKVKLPNDPPQITCPPNLTFPNCGSSEGHCFYVHATDEDCDSLRYQILQGPATVTDSTVCLNTNQPGQYLIKIAVYDVCGKGDTCTVTVSVTGSETKPEIECHQDTSIVVTGGGQICIPGFDCQFDSCYVYPQNTFSLSGDAVCFYPDTSGTYTVYFVAIDSCGGRDTCSSRIFVTRPNEPCDSVKISNHFNLLFEGVSYDAIAGTSKWDYVLTWDGTPPELSYFFIELCSLLTNANLVQVDPDFGSIGYNGNAGLWGIKWDDIQGTPANTPVHFSFTLNQLLAEANTIFAPKAGVNQNIATICGPSKDCELVEDNCDSNVPPVVTCPGDTTIILGDLSQICINGFTIVDADNNLYAITVEGGRYESGQVCFTPIEGTNVIRLIAVDSCGAADTCSTTALISRKNPPVCILPPDSQTIHICAGQDTCLVVTATDPDGDLVGCSVVSGPGQINDTLWCYAPAGNETVSVGIDCIDSAGQICSGTFTVTFVVENPPTIGNVDVTDVFLCDAHQPVCVDLSINNYSKPFTVTSTIGEFNLQDSSICFTADTSGTYCNRVIVSNSCGQADTIQYCIDVEINSAPEVSCPDSKEVFACQPDGQVCIEGFSYFDADQNYDEVSVIGGTLNGNAVCFPGTPGEHVITFIVTDECGLADTCQTTINVKTNRPPVIISLEDRQSSLCIADTLCYGLNVTDPDNNLSSISSNIGTVLNGVLCFSADSIGNYLVIISAFDSCGASDIDSFNVTVNLNQPPVVSLGQDFSVQLCGENRICVPFFVTDNNLANVSSNFAISGDSVCFTADTSGTYLVWVRAIDDCERVSADTILITVSASTAPFVDLGEDIRAKICSPTEFCIDVNTIANPASVVFNRVGYNPRTRKFCFTANETILDLLKVTVTDSCGRTATDSISVYIQLNTAPKVEISLKDTTIYLCQPAYVCLPVTFSDAQNNIAGIQVNHGNYSNGQVCFVPYDSGNYTIIATATDSCGAVTTDTAVVRVLTDQYVKLHCPKDTTVFMCQHDTLCFPIGEIPEWAQVQVSGINTWFDRENQQVCFFVSCGVSNRIVVNAITPCSTLTCSFTVNVVCNQPPVVALPPDTTIRLCGSDSIYIPIGVNDPNHNLHSVNVPSWAVYEPITSRIAFYADTSGTYVLNVFAFDSCEASSSDLIVVHVTLDQAPVCEMTNDTTIYLCQPGQVSLPIYTSDSGASGVTCSVVEGPGQIVNGYWVYQANSGGIVDVVVQCVDACENICRDSFAVDIRLNTSPVCSIPNDTTIAQCQPTEICLPISATDNDGNFMRCSIVRGPGGIPSPIGKKDEHRAASSITKNQQWCYTPKKDTSFYVVIRCEDSCGLACVDSFSVTVNINESPMVTCPGDTTILACSLSPVTLSGFVASDADGNLANSSVSGGQLSGNAVTFDPVVGQNLIVFSAYDDCEAYSVCSTIVTVRLNAPPVCSVPNDTTITGCSASQICLPVNATDADGNFIGCQVIEGPGAVENGFWCYSPSANGTYKIKIRCFDACETYCEDSFTVIFDAGTAPTIESQFFSTKFCDEFSQRHLQIAAGISPSKFHLLSGVGSIDSLSGILSYFPDTPGVYSFIVQVSNSCGSDSASVYDTVKANRPPEIIGFDSTVYLCQVQEICFDVFGFDSDLDSLNIQKILGQGGFTQTGKNSGKSCFTPSGTDSIRTYLFVYQVTDLCRDNGEGPFEYYYDTVSITVILDQPPVLNIPPAFSIFACSPDSACFRIPPHAPEAFPYEVEVLSGNAVVYGDTVACLLIDGAGDYVVTIKVTDSCGNSSIYSSTIHVEINTPPTINAPQDFATQACTSNNVCFEFALTDANNNIASIVASYGTINQGSQLCFSADTSGLYKIIITATDSCGAIDIDTVNVSVNVNQPPVVSLGPDFTIEICTTKSICLPFTVSDDNLIQVTSNASISGDSVCFVASTAGTYVIWVQATDQCEISRRDSIKVTVTSPPAPFVDLGNNINAKICAPTEFCIDVNTIANPASVVFNRVGYNPATRKFCFTASQTILDLLKVTVTDSCGKTATDSISVYIQFNSAPRVQVPMRDTTVYLCQPSYICLPLVFADSQNNIASIQVNKGQYSNGQVCFVPYDSGTYTIIATATDSCGAIVKDTAIVTVRTDQYVQLQCPKDTTVFMCTHDTLCFPIGDIPSWAQIQVTGINTWYDPQTKNVCFFVTCGVKNHIVVKAITPCSTKTCSFDVTVKCNQPPLVTLPPDTTVGKCAQDTVRIPVGISDPNLNIATVTTNSWANYDKITGKVNFVADTEGVYIVQVTATDSCGSQDFEDIVVNVQLNTPPTVNFAPADSIYGLCSNTQICLPINLTDREGNITQVIPSVGIYNPSNKTICFNPGDSSGLYCVTVRVIDACGAADTATKCIMLNNQGVVQIQCPIGPKYDTLCSADSICLAIPITGNPDSVKVNYGKYAQGQLCFLADTSGIYNIVLTAFSPCTTLTCQVQFRETIKSDVYVLCPDNDTVLVCAPDTVFYDFASASATSFSITPPAFISGSSIGLPILASGTFNLTLIASGACGADTCSFFVKAKINSAPKVVSAKDTTLTNCQIQQFCVPFTVSDSDGNIVSVVGPDGPITGNQYCFTPTGAGDYRIIIRATDACGATGVDTTLVRVNTTAADIFCPTGTQNRTICRGDSVRVTVPITPFEATVQVFLDGISNGYYNRDSALVIVFPQNPGSHTIRIIASAGCVTDTCNIGIFVNFLERTDIMCPSVIDTFVCPVAIDSICFPVTVLGTNVTVTVNNGGKYSNGHVCVPVSHGGPLSVRIIASGACGVDTCITNINVNANNPPVLHLPSDTTITLCDYDTSFICIGGIYADDESAVTLNKICGPGTFTKIGTDSGFICFKPTGNIFGDYNFCFEVNDGCSAKTDTFKVTLVEGAQCNQCLTLTIDGGPCVPVGGVKKVALKIESYRAIGGFEILLSYDASVTAFSTAQITGTSIEGWEYFNYRMNSAACAPVCPSGILRLVGLAETNNGANHPPASTLNPNGVLINLYFLLTNDQNVEGQFLPIRFVTYECSDNTFSDPTGNDLFVDSKIYNNENIVIWDEGNNTTYPESIRPFGLGTRDSCITGVGKGTPKRCIEFVNGGICILSNEEIDDRGDINLNGVSYEVADAVLFTNYFIYGLQVFTVNVAGQIAATDVNADGISLSVADLVLLIRVIIGDALPLPKLNPHEVDLQLLNSIDSGNLTVSEESVNGLGAAYFVYNLENTRLLGDPVATSAINDMELRYHVENNELRILIFSLTGESIESGNQALFKLSFEGRSPLLTKAEFADRDGRPYNIASKTGELPSGFELFQNYPNPFNPSTTLSFSLPKESDWTLTVFNVNGATVRKFDGANVSGLVEVFWDGRSENNSEVASGVYFYKLEAGKFIDTKKMILLK